VPLPRERLWGRLRQRRQTLDRIRVPMIGSLYSVRVDQPSIRLVAIAIESHGSTYQLVPHPSRLKVLGPTHPNLLVIPHRKLGARQPLPRGLLCQRKRQGLVLVKRPLGPTQEPLAERHVRLDFPLLTGERVVLDAQQGVEREGGERKLVRVPELVLRRHEIEERGALLVGPTSAGG
jgi:hypothetical protein